MQTGEIKFNLFTEFLFYNEFTETKEPYVLIDIPHIFELKDRCFDFLFLDFISSNGNIDRKFLYDFRSNILYAFFDELNFWAFRNFLLKSDETYEKIIKSIKFSGLKPVTFEIKGKYSLNDLRDKFEKQFFSRGYFNEMDMVYLNLAKVLKLTMDTIRLHKKTKPGIINKAGNSKGIFDFLDKLTIRYPKNFIDDSISEVQNLLNNIIVQYNHIQANKNKMSMITNKEVRYVMDDCSFLYHGYMTPEEFFNKFDKLFISNGKRLGLNKLIMNLSQQVITQDLLKEICMDSIQNQHTFTETLKTRMPFLSKVCECSDLFEMQKFQISNFDRCTEIVISIDGYLVSSAFFNFTLSYDSYRRKWHSTDD